VPRRSRHGPRIADELRYHRDRLIDDYVAAGMDRQAAERRAFLEFGNVAPLEEQVKDVRGRLLADLRQDLRYAFRMLRRAPGFAAVAILSLALGIGANAGVFSVINSLLLRPLPVTDPARLVIITRVGANGRPTLMAYRSFELLRDRMTSVSSVSAIGTQSQTVIIDGDDELVAIDIVSGSYFNLLGIRPAAGRLLAPADDVAVPETPAAVISDALWNRRFGRSPAAIGKTIALRERTFAIAGVAAPGFHGIRPDRAPDVFVPLGTMLSDEERQAVDLNNFLLMARLVPGATVARANAEVQALYGGYVQMQAAHEREKDRPRILRQRAEAFAAPDGFNEFRYAYRRSLLILMGTVGLVLLLACVNLSGLLLARAERRQREVSIRLAIGAGRGRLLRQFLAESLLLAVAGGTIGLFAAGMISARLFTLLLNGRAQTVTVAPDWRVAGFTAAIALASCLLAGLAPALHAVRDRFGPALKDVRARGTRGLGKKLVVAQLMISMILLVVASLFIGTLLQLQRVDRGLDANGVLAVVARALQPYQASRSRVVASAVVEQLSRIPGVRSATAAQMLPLTGSLWDRTVQVEGYRFRDDEPDDAGFNAVAPAYFATVGTPFVTGRDFDARDTGTSPHVAIVTESFARYFFGTAPAIGRHVTSAGIAYEIVGVVGDARYQSLRDPMLRTVYIPWTQRDGNQPTSWNYLVRVASGDPRQVVPELPRVLRDADPGLRVRQARPYGEIIDASIGSERTMATLGAAFGGLAMLVAAIGVFGLLAFHVARRTNEIAVRLALGAGRGRMVIGVLRDVATLCGTGIALGAAAAWMSAGVVRSLLFGVTPTQPAVFAVAALALATVTLVAGWLPARRAANVDPIVALRHE
jgi:predicted permease